MEIYDLKRLYDKNADKSDILQAYKEILDKEGLENFGEKLIFLAADFIHFDALKTLIELGVDPHIVDDYKFTLLHRIAKMDIGYYYEIGQNDIENSANLLLNCKVSVLKKDENENMACYHYAARSGNYLFVETLAKRGAKLNLTDKEGNTGIHIASQYVKHKIHSLELLKKDLEFKKQHCQNDEKLINSVTQEIKQRQNEIENYFKTVKAFADGGVEIDAKNSYDISALDIAVKNNAKKIAAFLSGTLTSDDDEKAIIAGGMTLFQAADKEDGEAIAAIAKTGVDINGLCVKDEYNKRDEGWSALAIACERLSVEAVEALLENGADPSVKNSGGKAAIAFCLTPKTAISSTELFTKNIPAIVKALVKGGFDINEPVDEELNTILNLACKCSETSRLHKHSFKSVMIEEALRYKANINTSNRFGQTPLMNACKDEFDIMEKFQLMFLEDGAEVNAKDNDGNAALHYAAKNDSKNGAKILCDMLLEFGADANAVNNQGESPLDIATKTDNEPLVKLLLSKI
jgi:ankyrin repeat protein